MNKRKLSAIQREEATDEMMCFAQANNSYSWLVTSQMVEGEKILLLNFFDIKKLKKGKREATYRTFLSVDDYITQDLKQSKVKWLTAAIENMSDICIYTSSYNSKTKDYEIQPCIYMSEADKRLISEFVKDYERKDRGWGWRMPKPWRGVVGLQDKIRSDRLDKKHKKELEIIDVAMKPFENEPEPAFQNWCFDVGMSFSRYVIYQEVKKGKAECQCTHCNSVGVVDRNEIRLRHNEQGECPFCGSKVTFKAKGKMPSMIRDERWFAYTHPTEEGFAFRYHHASRVIKLDKLLGKVKVEDNISELKRTVFTFPDGKAQYIEYEWGVYKQRGSCRWCPTYDRFGCHEAVLYPGNLPSAWAHTPMKYSAFEILSTNAPNITLDYVRGVYAYMKFPKLEWMCKMGLNRIAAKVVHSNAGGYANGVGKINYEAETIYEILGLTKENVRILQEIDANDYELRLMQVAQDLGIRFKPEQLRAYYETFECNVDLLKASKGKITLHKLVKYITKESEHYPTREKGLGCRFSYYTRSGEREDPRLERKRNCAHDWLEYLEWCKELKYDLNNMFIFMPNNFKKVHDRTMTEYQALQDKKAAAEKRRKEREAAKRLAQIQKDMEEIFKQNNGADAFSIKGKGLILVVPKTGAEIKAEGEALHHCVGSYVDKVARGETSIFFVRKASEPDKSYFTMEWNNNKIVQCRGLRNCGMPPEVEAFVKTFEKKMLANIEKGDVKNHGKGKKKNLQPA